VDIESETRRGILYPFSNIFAQFSLHYSNLRGYHILLSKMFYVYTRV